MNRRSFITNSLASLPLASAFDPNIHFAKPLRVVCVGGHPDDPETGCGGTLAKFANAGHEVTIIYLTNGDAGIKGKNHQEAAAIRTEEAKNACKILKVKPVFAGQVDGDTIVNNEWYTKIRKLLEAEKPDIIFTHWPVDSHKDHMAASLLTQKVHLDMGQKCPLYFFEVNTGSQTQNFNPTDFVDITDTQEQKRKAVFCHASQGFVSEEFYHKFHGIMEDFRGLSISVKGAEGFVKLTSTKSAII
ncbi:PIG-L deacetylase family protein [Dyadobacter sp. NIV53]|uniref:PIG-L deacetylase family protein n=1 Tax=Dyadobacter sp. NIV53 TaxID=2861765 RepID=UPI001C8880F4|nr:PIG-L deacetylase family protein [Dyadobacter sp. NIV53]